MNLQEILEKPESPDIAIKASNFLKTFHRRVMANGKSLMQPNWNPRENEILNYENTLTKFIPFLKSYLPEDAQRFHKQITSDLRKHPRWIPDFVDSLSDAQKEQVLKLLNETSWSFPLNYVSELRKC